jgi:hypothetical protein
VQWCIPGISATQETEIRKPVIESWPAGAKLSDTPSQQTSSYLWSQLCERNKRIAAQHWPPEKTQDPIQK